VLVEADTTPSEYPLMMIDPLSGADKRLTVAWIRRSRCRR